MRDYASEDFGRMRDYASEDFGRMRDYASEDFGRMRDYASEDFEWPEVKDLRPAEAGRLLDDIERQAAEANKRAKVLRERKAIAQEIVMAVAEEYELASVDFVGNSGRRVAYTPSHKDHFTIVDEAAFVEWAGEDFDVYYDTSPRLREETFRDEMRRRYQDGEGLPPGVKHYVETKLSRSTKVQGSRPSADGEDLTS